MRPAPNSALAIGMTRPSPTTERRAASQSAPSSAPQPDAVIRKPSVCGPPWNTCVANTGISTRVRHADEADEREQQDDRSNRAEAERVREALA